MNTKKITAYTLIMIFNAVSICSEKPTSIIEKGVSSNKQVVVMGRPTIVIAEGAPDTQPQFMRSASAPASVIGAGLTLSQSLGVDSFNRAVQERTKPLDKKGTIRNNRAPSHWVDPNILSSSPSSATSGVIFESVEEKKADKVANPMPVAKKGFFAQCCCCFKKK